MLTRLAQHRGQTLARLVATADAERTPDQPLASGLRVMALMAVQGGEIRPVTEE